MRVVERLQLLLGLLLIVPPILTLCAATSVGKNARWIIFGVITGLQLMFVCCCGHFEGSRIQQMPNSIGFFVFIICYSVGEAKDNTAALLAGIIIAMIFWLWSLLMLVMYGDENIEEMEDPNGPCSVGLKRFWSK